MRVLVPTVPRVYQPNPGSGATTQVTMKADAPWSRTVTVGKARNQISGLGAMSGLGITTTVTDTGTAQAVTAPAAQPDTTQAGWSWTSALNSILPSALKIAEAGATAAINKQLGPKLTTTQQFMPYTYAAGPNWVVIGGIVAALGVGIFFMSKANAKGKRRGRR